MSCFGTLYPYRRLLAKADDDFAAHPFEGAANSPDDLDGMDIKDVISASIATGDWLKRNSDHDSRVFTDNLRSTFENTGFPLERPASDEIAFAILANNPTGISMARVAYLTPSLEELKRSVEALTLQDFSDVYAAERLSTLILDECGDWLFDLDSGFVDTPMNFVRSLSMDSRYYFSSQTFAICG